MDEEQFYKDSIISGFRGSRNRYLHQTNYLGQPPRLHQSCWTPHHQPHPTCHLRQQEEETEQEEEEPEEESQNTCSSVGGDGGEYECECGGWSGEVEEGSSTAESGSQDCMVVWRPK